MSAFDQEQKKLTMDVESGDQKSTSEPVGKREMSASDDEQKKLTMDVGSANQEPTAAKPMGEMEMSGSRPRTKQISNGC